MKGQWALLIAGLTVAAFIGTWSGALWRVDALLYDALAWGDAAPDDIAIIGIDEKSLAVLGRWPWRRSIHAELLRRLAQDGARAIALDLILTDPDTEHPDDDALLVEAMRAAPPVTLPLEFEFETAGMVVERGPIPALRQAAAAVGHVDLELDRDGIARSAFLYEGVGAANRPHLMLALLGEGNASHPLSEHSPVQHPDQTLLERDRRILIHFLGPPGHFHRYSYIDVLESRLPKNTFRNKIVLVGMVAGGGADAHPTPVSGHGVPMPGVEINANILQDLRAGSTVRPAPQWLAAVLSALLVAITCLGLLRLAARQALLWVISLGLMAEGGAMLALHVLHVWIPIAATLTVLIFTYPLWSWRRLELVQRFMESELRAVLAERSPLPQARTSPPQRWFKQDLLQRRVEVLSDAARRMRDLQSLFSDTVNALTDATLVINLDGNVVLANAAAAKILGGQPSLGQQDWPTLLRRVQLRELIDSNQPVVELRHGKPERDLLFRLIPFMRTASAERLGTLVSIVDISDLRAVQREREDIARFLSHDLKGPASSILALAELQRSPERAVAPVELAGRLQGLAQRMLDLLDGFVALAQAESIDPTLFSDVDMRDVIQDAADEIWALAESRHIAVSVLYGNGQIMLFGNRSLLSRAVVNLLNNAIKYSPSHSVVTVRCQTEIDRVEISVIDHGPGVSSEMEPHLFKRFSRDPRYSLEGPAGAGLGLALVKVVAEKHGGSVRYVSTQAGACFELRLPLMGSTTNGPQNLNPTVTGTN